ncbi:MAG: class I SAM-dependent methyltransferase [Vicinamibacterales bacterium]
MTLPAYANNQQSFPAMYERLLVGPLFRPWAEDLIGRLQPTPGEQVLDIACGTGIVARLAHERVGPSGRVVGVDVSPAMLEVARAVAPAIAWREGSALDLPLATEERFDVVTCQQGLQFFPDRAAAAAQMRRALAPGGRLGVATWRPAGEIPMFHALQGIAERHLGPVADQRHAFGDGEALDALLRGAGLDDVRVETVTRTLRFDDGATFVRMNTMALVGMSAAGKTMDDAARAAVVNAIVADSAEVLRGFADGSAVVFAISSNVATARA